ncbi:hypothetical protein NL50_13795 [Clostridium acetobutylicum]|nr:hypothetical protein NL50_13795 [Clostridium acetobutylicum]
MNQRKPSRGSLGKKGGQFVLPQRIEDSISNSTPEFKPQLAKELGLPKDVFANGIVRVEVPLDGALICI